MLTYLIKANVVLVVLFGFYQLISAGDTFFKWRRLSLLTVYVLSLLLPTIDLSVLVNETAPLGNILPRMAYNLPEVMVKPTRDAFDWHQLAVWLYAGVALACSCACFGRLLWCVGWHNAVNAQRCTAQRFVC